MMVWYSTYTCTGTYTCTYSISQWVPVRIQAYYVLAGIVVAIPAVDLVVEARAVCWNSEPCLPFSKVVTTDIHYCTMVRTRVRT